MRFCATRQLPVDVLAFLSPPLLAHLRVTLGSEHSLAAARTWDEVSTALRHRVVDVMVLDPAADGATRSAEILTIVALYPTQPLIIYLALSPGSLRAVVELARHGVSQVVLHRFDDDLPRFRALLGRQHNVGIVDAALSTLGRPMSMLPVSLARAVRQLFERPHRFWSAQDLALAAAMPRRTMYRDLAAAGFLSPRRLVLGARLLRAYGYLREPGYLVADVVAKLGYGSARVLVRHTRELVGATPSELRNRGTDGEFLTRLIAGIMAPEVASTTLVPRRRRRRRAGESGPEDVDRAK